jgi:hypothetical protein
VFIAAPVAVFVPELDDVFAGVLEVVVPVPEPVPDEPAVLVDPDDWAGAALASGVAAVWAWKPSTAAVPKAVAETTIGARFIACSSEGE